MGIHSDMDVENKKLMSHFPNTDYQNQFQLYCRINDIHHEIAEFAEHARQNHVTSAVSKIIAEKYDIGILSELYQIFGGYANDTYGIYTNKNGERLTWIFRIYKSRKSLKEVKFEHNLLCHARKRGFKWGSVPILSKDGSTYQRIELSRNNEDVGCYCAIYEFIDGDEPYDWIKNWASDIVPERTYTKAAEILAEFHNSVRDFDPEGLNRQEPPINELVQLFPEMLEGYQNACAEQGRLSIYTDYIDNQFEYIKDTCKKTVIPACDYEKLIINAIQCDFHPGNLKFDKDGITCGIYDFDWGKIDIRLFEIGLGVVYSFVSWVSENDGEINLSNSRKFIDAYNTRLKEMDGLSPINKYEKKYFFESLQMANIYLFLWCTRLFSVETGYNEYEYLYYLQHQIRCCKWVETHEKEIRQFSEEL